MMNTIGTMRGSARPVSHGAKGAYFTAISLSNYFAGIDLFMLSCGSHEQVFTELLRGS
jgi:hypothetical protein